MNRIAKRLTDMVNQSESINSIKGPWDHLSYSYDDLRNAFEDLQDMIEMNDSDKERIRERLYDLKQAAADIKAYAEVIKTKIK